MALHRRTSAPPAPPDRNAGPATVFSPASDRPGGPPRAELAPPGGPPTDPDAESPSIDLRERDTTPHSDRAGDDPARSDGEARTGGEGRPSSAGRPDAGVLPRRAPRSETLFLRLLPWAIAFAIWGLLAYAGYETVQRTLQAYDARLQTLADENAALEADLKRIGEALAEQEQAIGEIRQAFAGVQEEFSKVKDELTRTGKAIQATDATRQALSQRIADLGKELERLRAQIQKLEEAARVY
ncbi:MAG: hypothetical protein IMX05_06630 [Hydrogenibacillus schlegelii]|nr:hypothetical protein [Hydrogenibacillus schlegelii]